jgi:hypothetical protein
MYKWHSTTKSQHWEQKQWTPRTSIETGSKNILRKSPVDPKNILLPPLHIQLGIIKQFVKAFAKNWKLFQVPLQNVSSFVGGQTKLRLFRWP